MPNRPVNSADKKAPATSRQYRWSEKNVAEGKCRVCTKKRVNSQFCLEHANKAYKPKGAEKRSFFCSQCGERGHNKRTCALRHLVKDVKKDK